MTQVTNPGVPKMTAEEMLAYITRAISPTARLGRNPDDMAEALRQVISYVDSFGPGPFVHFNEYIIDRRTIRISDDGLAITMNVFVHPTAFSFDIKLGGE